MREDDSTNNGKPKGAPEHSGTEKPFEKGHGSGTFGSDKSDSGEYGRGQTKPPRPKDGK
jgi:hypothetical protein